MDQQSADPHQKPIERGELGGPFPGTIENHQLMFQKKRFGEDALCPARPEEAGSLSDKVHEEKEYVLHNAAKVRHVAAVSQANFGAIF